MLRSLSLLSALALGSTALVMIEIGAGEVDFTGDGSVEPGFSDPDVTPAPEMSSGDQLGSAVGQHLGKLLGQGIADLFR
ncbi:hypothetical protein SynRS9909_02687 [Synechococcus sp. RS9909]|uniref:hypothetical protein n=1 Tax=unclassified Synechococcus TaxID=2626047 RepID=UPI0000690666|nr:MULTISPECIES: hypothetical protein [unclassified Synechococcus]EAQ70472.1 hypothetical protein RS9917_06535 [Synechococcus sp. RS9917]QNI80656.1 hypothetical protein SynRS9909_02687 [Synechococcus sp. RS9909]